MLRNFFRAWPGCIAILIFTGVVMASAPALMAQTAGTGALVGTLTDPSGAVVPNATVTATSLDTGQARTATTGADGTYKITLLPPGNYRVRFEVSGFRPVEVPSASVNVTETEVLDRTLEVGAQTQTVTVEGEVEIIQATSSALGTVANTRTMTELPLNTRNFTNLLAMSAGANSSVQDASQIGKGGSFIAVNGGGFGQNTYLQDGVDVDDWFSFNTGAEGLSGGSFPIPNPDAIAEFKIQTSSYDAGYGRNPGANVNVVTKSGTNNLHGAAFEFFRNTALNANNWFFNFNGLQKPVLNSNQYGGVFGGPIKKDKLFFFVSYQETDQKNGLTGFGSSNVTLPPVPTGDRGTCPAGWTVIAQCDAAAQAFVPALAAAVCPANHPGDNRYTTNVATSVQVQCGAGAAGANGLFNMNPVAINALQLKVANGSYLVPSPGALNPARAGTFLPWTFSDPASFHDHNFMGNWDYVLSNKHTLSGRYLYEADPIKAPFAVQNSSQVQSFLPGQPVETTHQDHAATLRLTSVLTNNLVNQGYIAYQRFGSVAPITTPFTNSQIGVADLNPGEDFMSFFTLTGLFQFGQQYQYGLNNPTNQYQAGDQISWTRGKHTFRTGFGAERVQTRTYFPGHGVGNPTFAKFADFLIGRAGNCGGPAIPTSANPGGCNGSPSSNLNTVGTFTTLNSTFSDYFRVLDLNGFVQDDFKISPRLTVNLGLRWEYDGFVTEKNGLMSNIWPSLVTDTALPGSTPQTGTLAGYLVPGNYKGPVPAGLTVNSNNSVNQSGAPKDDFAPRVGFAWQPTRNNRWVLRGGAGYFYDVMPGVTLLNVLEVTAPALLPPVISGLTSASLANPWQSPQGTIAGPAGTAGFAPRWVTVGNGVSTGISSSNISQNAIQQDMGVPLTYEWNLNTQYQFLSNWVLELGYVGSHGIHQASVSRATLQGQAGTQPYNIAPLVGPDCTSCALTGVTTNTVANAPLRVPELGVSAQNNEIATLGSYKFNSLQVTVRKQFSKGFQLQAAYTWSRAFIALPFGINTAPYLVEAYEPNNNYHPHRFVFNYVWNLPFGHPQGWKGALVDGWSLSGVTTIQDGVNMTIEDTGGSIFFGGQGVGSVSAFSSTAQLCPGKTYADLLTSGSIQDRVTSGLTGGPGYLNGKAQGVLCNLSYWDTTAKAFVPLAPGQSAPSGAVNGGSGFGNMGGGAVLGPPQSNWDMSIAKNFRVREAQSLQFRTEFFNTFNHPQFAIPNTLASGSTYGQISNTSVNPRIIQMALKYSF